MIYYLIDFSRTSLTNLGLGFSRSTARQSDLYRETHIINCTVHSCYKGCVCVWRFTHQSSQLHLNWKLLKWWENQLISLVKKKGEVERMSDGVTSDRKHLLEVPLSDRKCNVPSGYLSMQLVFMVSSLMYIISVAWANWQAGVKIKILLNCSQPFSLLGFLI